MGFLKEKLSIIVINNVRLCEGLPLIFFITNLQPKKNIIKIIYNIKIDNIINIKKK